MDGDSVQRQIEPEPWRERVARLPVYQQVRSILTQRIEEGVWRPGSALPSEYALATEFRVSIGTVRKAIDQLTADRRLRREQGRGTFVMRPPDGGDGAPCFLDRDGRHVAPALRTVAAQFVDGDCPAFVARAFGGSSRLLRVTRLARIDDAPVYGEDAFFPLAALAFTAARAPEPPAPREAARLFAQLRAGVIEQRVGLLVAAQDEAERLAVGAGAPLLTVERVARDNAGAALAASRLVCADASLRYVPCG